jgi:hypothetical protein
VFSSPIVTGGFPVPGSEIVVVVVAVVVAVVVVVTVTVLGLEVAAVAECEPAPQPARPSTAIPHAAADPIEPMSLAPRDIELRLS